MSQINTLAEDASFLSSKEWSVQPYSPSGRADFVWVWSFLIFSQLLPRTLPRKINTVKWRWLNSYYWWVPFNYWLNSVLLSKSLNSSTTSVARIKPKAIVRKIVTTDKPITTLGWIRNYCSFISTVGEIISRRNLWNA